MTCKFEISGPHRLTCRAVRKLLQAFTRRHVPCAMCHQSTYGRHHRRSGVLARRMVPLRARSDHPFGRYSRKCLDTHTDWPTNTSGQLFFTDPPVEIFVHRTFNAKAFERSFTTILDKKALSSCKNVPWLKLSWSEPPPGSSFSATHDWNWYWAYYQAASRALRSTGGTLAPERSLPRIAARSGTNCDVTNLSHSSRSLVSRPLGRCQSSDCYQRRR